jgi:hypothetical protein
VLVHDVHDLWLALSYFHKEADRDFPDVVTSRPWQGFLNSFIPLFLASETLYKCIILRYHISVDATLMLHVDRTSFFFQKKVKHETKIKFQIRQFEFYI